MTDKPPLRRPFVKISVAVAVAAWFVLIALVLVRILPKERAGSLCMVIAGWPVIYAAVLGVCWFAAKFVTSVDESFLYGPAKDLQLKLLRGPMCWWINIVAVLFPLAAFVVALVFLIGGAPKP